MRMVSSSTLASEMRTSPATTRPLSRMRSRMSTREVLWTRRGSSVTDASQQVAQWTEIDVQIAWPQPELTRQLLHFLFQLHQGQSDALHLLVREVAAFHSAYSLPLEQLSNKLDQRQHQLCQTLFDAVGIDVDVAGQVSPQVFQFILKTGQLVLHSSPMPSRAKLYGGHGPLTSIRTSCGSSRFCAAAFTLSMARCCTSSARDTATPGRGVKARWVSTANAASVASSCSATSVARRRSASACANSRCRCSKYRRPGALAANGGCSCWLVVQVAVTASSALPRTRSNAFSKSTSRLSSRSRKAWEVSTHVG